MSLEKLIESYYAPKKGNDLLIKLIESKINEAYSIQNIEQAQKPIDPKDKLFYGDERTLKLPIIRFSKQIGRKNNYERSFLELVVSNIAKISGSAEERMEQRISAIQKFLDPNTGIDPNIKISEIMSYCILVEAFYHLINDYDATVAGDLFEPLFAAMFDGTIVEGENTKKRIDAKEAIKEPEEESVEIKSDTEPGAEITKRNPKAEDVIIPTGIEGSGLPASETRVSLKLISEKGNVKQNFKNILTSILKYKDLYYVVGFKEGKGSISFYGFNLSEDTILEAVSNLNDIFPPALVTTFKNEKNKNKNYSVASHMLNYIERSNRQVDQIKNDIEELQKYIKKNEELITAEFTKKNQRNMDFIKLLQKEVQQWKNSIAQLAGQQKLIQHDSSMTVTGKYARSRKKFGTITYTKQDLENALTKYTNVVNNKVTNIYDNLSLLTNSINDFFLQSQGEDINLARTSIDKTRQVEQSIITYMPEAAK